jgi:hypothetical protein
MLNILLKNLLDFVAQEAVNFVLWGFNSKELRLVI